MYLRLLNRNTDLIQLFVKIKSQFNWNLLKDQKIVSMMNLIFICYLQKFYKQMRTNPPLAN